jgi:hypothetical protein
MVTQAANLEVHEVPDGYIVYQTERDRVHYLNTSAAAIFEFCNGQHDAATIVARVADAFELGPSGRAEIRAALDSLLQEGLVLSTSK